MKSKNNKIEAVIKNALGYLQNDESKTESNTALLCALYNKLSNEKKLQSSLISSVGMEFAKNNNLDVNYVILEFVLRMYETGISIPLNNLHPYRKLSDFLKELNLPNDFANIFYYKYFSEEEVYDKRNPWDNNPYLVYLDILDYATAHIDSQVNYTDADDSLNKVARRYGINSPNYERNARIQARALEIENKYLKNKEPIAIDIDLSELSKVSNTLPNECMRNGLLGHISAIPKGVVMETVIPELLKEYSPNELKEYIDTVSTRPKVRLSFDEVKEHFDKDIPPSKQAEFYESFNNLLKNCRSSNCNFHK